MTTSRQDATLVSRRTGPPLPFPFPFRGSSAPQEQKPRPERGAPACGPRLAAGLVGEAGIPLREAQLGPGPGVSVTSTPFPKRPSSSPRPSAPFILRSLKLRPRALGLSVLVARWSGALTWGRVGQTREARSPAAEARLEGWARCRRLQPPAPRRRRRGARGGPDGGTRGGSGEGGRLRPVRTRRRSHTPGSRARFAAFTISHVPKWWGLRTRRGGR